MNVVELALARIRTDLDAIDARWALVGGFAVSAWAEPRFTRDVDLAVSVADDAGAESVVRALVMRGYQVVATVEQEYANHLATVRLGGSLAATADVGVDLLFASSGVEGEIVSGAAPLEMLPGLTVPCARVGDLIALKLLARDDDARPQDAADLRALGRVATDADLERAAELVALIETRGYGRGRDLAGALSRLGETISRPSDRG